MRSWMMRGQRELLLTEVWASSWSAIKRRLGKATRCCWSVMIDEDRALRECMLVIYKV